MRGILAAALLTACTAAAGTGADDTTAPADGAIGAAPDAPPGTTPDAPPGTAPDAAPASADPAADGPFDVTATDTNAAGTSITVYVPDTGPAPLVIVSPGFQMPRDEYAAYAHRIATHGFVAITQDFGGGFSPDHQAYADQTHDLVDWALAGGGGLLTGHTSGEVGLAGHSMGGKVSLLAATADARVDAIVGWDPVDAGDPSVAPEKMGAIHAAIVLLGETTDADGGFMPCAPAENNYAQYYAAAGSPAIAITVPGADHMDFVDDPSCALCGFCTAGTADSDAVHALASRTAVAAFRRYLRGDTTMDAYLTGAVIAADGVTIQSK